MINFKKISILICALFSFLGFDVASSYDRLALLKKIDIFSGNAVESDLVLLLHLFIHEDNVL